MKRSSHECCTRSVSASFKGRGHLTQPFLYTRIAHAPQADHMTNNYSGKIFVIIVYACAHYSQVLGEMLSNNAGIATLSISGGSRIRMINGRLLSLSSSSDKDGRLLML